MFSISDGCTKIKFFSIQRPDSRDFTSISQLIALYKKLNKDVGKFEVIDVSLDTEEEDWQKYIAFIPWISLHYGDNYKKVLCKHLDFHFSCKATLECFLYFTILSQIILFVTTHVAIPALIVMNENGTIITTEGWSNMLGDPEGNVRQLLCPCDVNVHVLFK